MRHVTVHVVRIFVNESNEFGSSVGIVIDEGYTLSSSRRLEITRQLGFSETVFVNQIALGDMSIYSKQGEIAFASPLLGAVWFVEQQGKRLSTITCQSKFIDVLHDKGLTWLRLPDTSTLPPWDLHELPNPTEVDRLRQVDRSSNEHTLFWAPMGQKMSTPQIRARTFAPGWGIPEEEANGSGSMLLAHRLGKSIDVLHGKGSHIQVITNDKGLVIGGSVCQDADRIVS